MYIPLCSLAFGVTLIIFQNSKKNSPKIKINQKDNKKIGNTKSKKPKAFIHILIFSFNVLFRCVCVFVFFVLFLFFLLVLIYFSYSDIRLNL